MKILLCSSEIVPFAKTGGLADVAGALPSRLKKQGVEIILAMPKYKGVDEKKFKIHNVSDTVSACDANGIKVYFINNDFYFNRDGLYGDKFGDYKDNLDRFLFYCTQTLALLKNINFKPDVIHCNDWQSSLVPVFLKNKLNNDPFYKEIKTVLTIHNLAYQGLFPADEFGKLSLDPGLFGIGGLEFYGKINLLKGGIVFSDAVNTVSANYAKEILTSEFGCGLEGVLAGKKQNLSGILNGLDYDIWDPAIDKFIFKKFSPGSLENKYENKHSLQKELGLALKKDVPLFGMVSRLARQKGLDLIAADIEKIAKSNVQLVILGTGEAVYHDVLEKMRKKYPKVISANIKFDDVLAHKIYAASDVFLMPSRYEPCGLGQLISFKYGTIPLAFKTGGLADTVSAENGFVFDKYDVESFLNCFKKAQAAYKNKKKWQSLVKRAFTYDFSWDESAKKYINLYKSLSR